MIRRFTPEYTLVGTRSTSGKASSQLWVRFHINIYAGVHRFIALKGDQHKKQRKMMNPVFSINYMRELSKKTVILIFKSTTHFSSYSSTVLWSHWTGMSGPSILCVLERCRLTYDCSSCGQLWRQKWRTAAKKLMYFDGCQEQRWSWSVKVEWAIPLTIS